MKVGLNQANRPAPLWFRRLRDASVNFLLPALGQLITSLNLTDTRENLWLQVLTFLPAAFNFVGVLLGDDVKKKMRVWLLVGGAACLMSGCKSVEKIAAEAARARQQHMELLHQVRIAYPCAPDTIIRGLTVYLPGDSVPCPANGKCPPQGVRVDTLKVLDEAALAAVRDSLAQANYVDSLKDVRIDELTAGNAALAAALASERNKTAFWRRIVLWAGGIIVSVLVGWLVIGGKLSFIKKVFTWLISVFR